MDFSTLSEPSNCREHVSLHHFLGVDADDWLLNVAWASGLAIEWARLRGALCGGIDAAALVAVARLPSPECDIQVGDMRDLPWEKGAFDVVISFRGIWGSTPDALAEIGLTRLLACIPDFSSADHTTAAFGRTQVNTAYVTTPPEPPDPQISTPTEVTASTNQITSVSFSGIH